MPVKKYEIPIKINLEETNRPIIIKAFEAGDLVPKGARLLHVEYGYVYFLLPIDIVDNETAVHNISLKEFKSGQLYAINQLKLFFENKRFAIDELEKWIVEYKESLIND